MVLHEAWGGVTARRALLLALLSISWVAIGCRRDTAPPPNRRFVRLETLLPLHPGWAQVTALEGSGATAQSALPLASGTLQARPLPMTAPFPPMESLSAGLESERQARLEEDKRRRDRIARDAQRRVERITQELQRRNDELLKRQQRLGKKEFENKLDLATTEMQAELPRRLASAVREYDDRIYRLGFKETAFYSQTQTFSGQAQADAQRQMKAVTDAIKLQQTAREQKRQEVIAQANRELEAKKAALALAQQQEFEQLKSRLDARFVERQQELNRTRDDQIRREEDRLRLELETRPQITTSVPASQPHLPAALEAGAAQANARAQAQVQSALTRLRTDMDAQKARLVEAIRADTDQAVRQIARQQGWTLVPEGTARAIDATKQTAPLLRAQWAR